jgi:hypothetical protein
MPAHNIGISRYARNSRQRSFMTPSVLAFSSPVNQKVVNAISSPPRVGWIEYPLLTFAAFLHFGKIKIFSALLISVGQIFRDNFGCVE